MTRRRFNYLIHLQYLGFRYHGWQKQQDVKTVQGMVDRTLSFLLGDIKFKTLGASRTDAMVSAHQSAFELFVWEELEIASFMDDFNKNLPSDIRVLKMVLVDDGFNVIKDPKAKEYVYLFSFGEKIHPFSAPYMACVAESLNIALMQQGATLYEGRHNFRRFCCRPNEETLFDRHIESSEIERNYLYSASFFPKESYLFRVKGKGFLRQQVRLMMGALFAVGRGAVTLEDLAYALTGAGEDFLSPPAPASGLILHGVDYH